MFARVRRWQPLCGGVTLLLCTFTPVLVRVASAEPAPVATTPATPPPNAPAATPPALAPAPTVLEPTPLAPPAAAPASATSATAPAATTPAPNATPPARDEYTGPPLLLASSQKKPTLGGYGGVTVAYSRMLHRDGVLVGGEGGMLIEHRLSIGGAGYGFSRTPGGPPAADGTTRQFATGYGGFLMRYAVFSDIPLYASFGFLVGGGAITLAPHHHENNHDENVEVRGFFVFQPEASVHVNMTRWLRLSLTAGYRFATSVDAFHYQADDVGGAVIGGNVQMGWF